MDIFQTLMRPRSLSVTAMLIFWGEANTSILGIGEDDTATGESHIYTGLHGVAARSLG